MLAMVGLVALVLVIAGMGSLLLTRKAARDQAQQQLVSEAQSLTSSKLIRERPRLLGVLRQTLKLEDADLIRIDLAGNLVTPLPQGLTAQDIDVSALEAGQTTSGRRGDLVFAASPVQLTQAEQNRLEQRNLAGTFFVLLTRNVGGIGPSWGYFIVAGGAALAIAALVAWQMSRRMSRPLVEAEKVTGRIAAGELESRVPVHRHDYPEFASLAGSVNRMAESLEGSRARERHLLLAVSHDLRTPLTSIRGFAEAIQDGAVDDSSQAADVIIAEARRLERLVGDLLDLTKLEAHQMSIAMRPTDAAEVVTTTAEGFVPAATRSGRRIRVQVPPASDAPADGGSHRAAVPLARVAADPDRLAQLLANLIENALTYARTTVTVSLADDPVGKGVVITVDDDGPGVAPDDLPRVFERFYRGDRGPNRPMGSGLGLAIVAELAAAMGGTVRAESPIGSDGGSRFVVTMPHWNDGPEAGTVR
jgi:signal transduction histidine kinase